LICGLLARHAAAVVLAIGAVAISGTVFAQSSALQTEGDQWRPTDRTMVDLVEEGYELVSVIASSNRSRTYFLRKTGKIAKCSETTALAGPPPVPPEVVIGARGTLSGPNIPAPEMRIDVECAELVRPASPK
jgi:hypothetical protein